MAKGERPRLDQHLVAIGRFESRARAQAAIAAGLVSIDGQPALKPAQEVAPGAVVTAEDPHPFVSRGGVKLAAALDAFGVDPAGLICLDVGASTGGFSDALLQRGAAHVTAIDSGRGQLHERLKDHPRLISFEGQDIRTLDAALLPAPPQLAVIDVSFISLTLVLPAVAVLLAPTASLIALVKPQFEVGRAAIGKGGVVRDEAARLAAVAGVGEALAALGFTVQGVIASPIEGGDGNVEYLIAAHRNGLDRTMAGSSRP
jgi:23S rRNA (cytidine1920-2'-O)/16S rRNA (cytidine1409-2'-O)-methyltransferase